MLGKTEGKRRRGQQRTRWLDGITDSTDMKEKKESEVAQSCLTLCDPMDCSLPGSSVHGIFQARVLEWVAISFSEDLLNPGNPGLLHYKQTLYRLNHHGNHVVNRHEFKQTSGDSKEQGSLVCCSPEGPKELDMT